MKNLLNRFMINDSGRRGRRPSRQVLLISYCLLLTASAFAFTNYVWTGSGTPSAPYNSWLTAAHSIQDAVDNAIEGNVVLVTNGIYTLSGQIYLATNNIILKSVNGALDTVIDGNLSKRCIYLKGDSVIDDFLIRNAKPAVGNGAGIFVNSGGAVLNCIFTNNTAPEGGGAIYAFNTLISNCYFKGNEAENGGGVFLKVNSSVKNCIFENNSALTNGGAVFFDGAGSGNVYDCIISSNSAKYGGGIRCESGGSVSNCIISGNSAIAGGGGVNCYSGGAVSDCSISGNSSGNGGGGTFCRFGGVISDCAIIGNNTASYGGGAYCYPGAVISRCTISSNSAGIGGGVFCYAGGAISDCAISGNSATANGGGVGFSYGGALTNCLITKMNTASFGGGVYSHRGDIYNCTIAGNVATHSGGGIFCTNGVNVVNSIIYDNQAVTNNNWQFDGSNTFFDYCCTVPIAGLPGGNGCITNDPEFIIPGSNYHLQVTSACRNSGSNMFWMIGATDLDGNPRIIGGVVDMGCYEYIPEPGKFIYFILFFLFGKNKINKFVTCLM